MTYSIVASDAGTGQVGVAVQSHWFSVGAIVPWARPGVGAVATQANAEVSYGPRALDLLAQGLPPVQALARLLAEDPLADSRQVAIVNATGEAAAHTGSACIPFAGHLTGEGFACQANIMTSERVWPQMAEAFAAASGGLADRLLAALDAAELAGGDVRGRQSAALLVVGAHGEPWRAEVSLRVEDHPEPLHELRRLHDLDGAYRLAGEADELLAAGRHQEAAELYVRASQLAPQSDELRFWAGLGLAGAGEIDAGTEHVASAIAKHPGWQELLARLPEEMAPAAQTVLTRLGATG